MMLIFAEQSLRRSPGDHVGMNYALSVRLGVRFIKPIGDYHGQRRETAFSGHPDRF